MVKIKQESFSVVYDKNKFLDTGYVLITIVKKRKDDPYFIKLSTVVYNSTSKTKIASGTGYTIGNKMYKEINPDDMIVFGAIKVRLTKEYFESLSGSIKTSRLEKPSSRIPLKDKRSTIGVECDTTVLKLPTFNTLLNDKRNVPLIKVSKEFITNAIKNKEITVL